MLLVNPLLLGRTAPTCLGLRSKAERKLGLAFNEYDSCLDLNHVHANNPGYMTSH
jgi:hypothetical protein